MAGEQTLGQLRHDLKSEIERVLKRLLQFVVIIAEVSAMAIIVAMILGLLPMTLGQTVWMTGVVTVAAAVLAFGTVRPARAILYVGLLLGAGVFMLPFLWLLSTSFKQPDETFVFPPKWLPPAAAAPRESPWNDKGEDLRLCMGDLRVRAETGDEHTLKVEWHAETPSVAVSTSLEGANVHYRFDGQGDRNGLVRLSTSVEVPFDEPLESVTVKMRQDGSWHRLHAQINCAGKSYREQDPLYLGSKQWRELTFAFQAPRTDQRFQGVWPLTVVGRSDVGAARQMVVTIEVEPLGRASATLAKWTQSYRDAWYADPNWPHYIGNSLLLVVMNVLGQMFACSMAAFALSRLRWPGRELAFGLVLATVMLPAMILLVPQFLIFRALGWYDTLLPLWVPAFAGTPFYIFMLRQFMLAIPKDLEEAARIDGCSWWGIYWRIMLPLMRPALAAVAIFTFMGTWNEFMTPLIYLSDARLYPLPLGLYNFSIKNANFFNMLMAASALMTLPAIALFLGAQPYFIEGVTFTGMKG